MHYKNIGAPIPRGGANFGEGTEFIETGEIFIPTDEEKSRFAHKLEPVSGEPAEAAIDSIEQVRRPSRRTPVKETGHGTDD